MNITKTCSKCGIEKLLNEFHKDKSKKDGRQSCCGKCDNKRTKKYQQGHKKEITKQKKEWYERTGREKAGKTSMYKNKLCPLYLGIVIGERLCRHIFKNVEVMPRNNTGFDIICGKGFKIDVKTACITLDDNKHPKWSFFINHNTTADYFILVAFNNLIDLNPLHLWMIPGKEINRRSGISIRPSTLHKWDKWKRDIDDAQLCCAELKEV